MRMILYELKHSFINLSISEMHLIWCTVNKQHINRMCLPYSYLVALNLRSLIRTARSRRQFWMVSLPWKISGLARPEIFHGNDTINNCRRGTISLKSIIHIAYTIIWLRCVMSPYGPFLICLIRLDWDFSWYLTCCAIFSYKFKGHY